MIRLGPGPTLLGTPDTGVDDATFERFVRETFSPETARRIPGLGRDDPGRFAVRLHYLAGLGRMPWLTWRSRAMAALYTELVASGPAGRSRRRAGRGDPGPRRRPGRPRGASGRPGRPGAQPGLAERRPGPRKPGRADPSPRRSSAACRSRPTPWPTTWPPAPISTRWSPAGRDGACS